LVAIIKLVAKNNKYKQQMKAATAKIKYTNIKRTSMNQFATYVGNIIATADEEQMSVEKKKKF
jgi:hypothetical protein